MAEYDSNDKGGIYDNELLFYGKKTGISIGERIRAEIIDTDTCLVVKAIVGEKTKEVANATYRHTEYYNLIETRVINNNGEIIYKKSEEVKKY